MGKLFSFLIASVFLIAAYSFSAVDDENSASITIQVTDLQNSNGFVQFSLYNRDGTIPDEYFEKYYRQLKVKISNQTATITFNDLPTGTYAVNILHDENDDGVIDKGMILPIEGLGFSNFKALNLFNRPSYDRAKFELRSDTTITIPVIYM